MLNIKEGSGNRGMETGYAGFEYGPPVPPYYLKSRSGKPRVFDGPGVERKVIWRLSRGERWVAFDAEFYLLGLTRNSRMVRKITRGLGRGPRQLLDMEALPGLLKQTQGRQLERKESAPAPALFRACFYQRTCWPLSEEHHDRRTHDFNSIMRVLPESKLIKWSQPAQPKDFNWETWPWLGRVVIKVDEQRVEEIMLVTRETFGYWNCLSISREISIDDGPIQGSFFHAMAEAGLLRLIDPAYDEFVERNALQFRDWERVFGGFNYARVLGPEQRTWDLIPGDCEP